MTKVCILSKFTKNIIVNRSDEVYYREYTKDEV